ncbi:MAG: DUF5106 domain-containing protein [Alistipes sp.]|nr:DUF5106 domain-containing protein [Candidatus Alistipes equi]
MHRFLLQAIFVLLLVGIIPLGCTKHCKKSIKEFPSVSIPKGMTSGAEQVYLQYHFWDKFDFQDTLLISRLDSTIMFESVVKYISLVGPMNQKPIRQMLEKASVSRRMLDYVCGYMEKVVHDPNSPLRSDELFIPLLKSRLSTEYYDEAERAVFQYDLSKASNNRIGHVANDFGFYTLKGTHSSLYKLKTDYTIIFINNPGCPMCMDLIRDLKEDEFINLLIDNNRLKVLAIYPDEDLTEFKKHVSNMDLRWINAYDKGCLIDEGNLYNLDAIPALYLLDASKRVIIKDSTSVPEISFVIRRMEDL